MGRHSLAIATAFTVALAVASGCGPERDTPGSTPLALRLVAFDNCDEALVSLRAAAAESVAASHLRYGAPGAAEDGGSARPDSAAGAAPGTVEKAAPEHSTTNTHEAGVDEPDLVKTDGRRIVTLVDGTLRVYDASRRVETGRLRLTEVRSAANLLMAGDRALVIGRGTARGADGRYGSQLVLTLVDGLDGQPRVAGRYTAQGSPVDARQVGATVRVVVRSSPEIDLPRRPGSYDEQVAASADAFRKAPIETWLPSYTIERDGVRTEGRVDCRRLSRPVQFSGLSLLTVLTFDLGRDALDNGDPVTLAADGDTVYSTGSTLYITNDQRWRAVAAGGGLARGTPPAQRTEIFAFETRERARPRFIAGGVVDGWLLNQYSMSEWDGHLRVATTTDSPGGRESGVSVLRLRGGRLDQVGHVGGLGKDERIYAVRFVRDTGYVVTFRQVDPLYTLDLRDPAAPKVTGELKITGYSAYLHPAGDDRLIGVGQEASEQGRRLGTQVSLFDVSDPAQPRRLAQHHVAGGSSIAEFDPHAFLYWPATGLLVLPMRRGSALVLRLGDTAVTSVGSLGHPGGTRQPIVRSLVIDRTLWTVSAGGLLASDLDTLNQQAWVPVS